ncbi:MAG: OB-fold nucleic acid binding domain-containing protein [Nanoarchaeota archaeon]
MEEKTILKIAVIVSILGLGFLFIYSSQLDLAVIPDLDLVGSKESVHLRGKINTLRVTEKATFLELEGEKVVTTDIIFFPEENILLHEGDYVEVFGTVEEYKGEKEVVASKVVLK